MNVAKRQKPNWMVLWLFQKYVSFRVWFGYYKRTFNYYFGAYAPLWIVTFLVNCYDMDHWRLNDENIRLRHVGYVVNENRYLTSVDIPKTNDENSDDSLDEFSSDEMQESKPMDTVTTSYFYDITARSAWYFGTIGNDYDGYMEYARYILPYNSNSYLYDNPDNEITVKYDTIKDNNVAKSMHTNVVVLSKTGEYRLQINNAPFIVGSVTFNTLSFLLDAE